MGYWCHIHCIDWLLDVATGPPQLELHYEFMMMNFYECQQHRIVGY